MAPNLIIKKNNKKTNRFSFMIVTLIKFSNNFEIKIRSGQVRSGQVRSGHVMSRQVSSVKVR